MRKSSWLGVAVILGLGLIAAVAVIGSFRRTNATMMIQLRPLNGNVLRRHQGQVLLEREANSLENSRMAGQALWLGENWYIDGLKDDGNYMVPDDAYTNSGSGKYSNSIFDFGANDGVTTSPETGLPSPDMTQYWIAGDGETHPALFDIKEIRANEDGGLPSSWYNMNEPVRNFQSDGSGEWAPGRKPTVMVTDGHVEFIDDGTTMAMD